MCQKVKRVTIPLRSSSKITYIFMVSFDMDVDPEPIVVKRITHELKNLIL